jgi:hypothetical protein
MRFSLPPKPKHEVLRLCQRMFLRGMACSHRATMAVFQTAVEQNVFTHQISVRFDWCIRGVVARASSISTPASQVGVLPAVPMKFTLALASCVVFAGGGGDS